jgi:hypothetical protein
MTDYRWKSNEPVITPPTPRLLLSDLQLLIFWALTSALGLAAGFFIGIGLAGGEPNQTIIVGSALSGVLIGWIEMLLLMFQRVRVKWWWVINTTIAFVTWGLAFPFFGAVNWLGGLIMGLLVGMFQYINLRNKVEQSGYWVLANIISWGVALALFLWLSSFMDLLLAWAICGLVAGAGTGWVMARLVHHPQWKYEEDEAPLRDNYQS